MSEILLKYAPQSVYDVLQELKLESSVVSIWLIGSRANQNSNSESDWDLLVFSSLEPTVVPQRRSNIDVIRIGPSGQGLLEGMGSELKFCFDNWHWTEQDSQSATYIEREFIAQEHVDRDAHEPIMRRGKRLAYLIWSRNLKAS